MEAGVGGPVAPPVQLDPGAAAQLAGQPAVQLDPGAAAQQAGIDTKVQSIAADFGIPAEAISPPQNENEAAELQGAIQLGEELKREVPGIQEAEAKVAADPTLEANSPALTKDQIDNAREDRLRALMKYELFNAVFNRPGSDFVRQEIMGGGKAAGSPTEQLEREKFEFEKTQAERAAPRLEQMADLTLEEAGLKIQKLKQDLGGGTPDEQRLKRVELLTADLKVRELNNMLGSTDLKPGEAVNAQQVGTGIAEALEEAGIGSPTSGLDVTDEEEVEAVIKLLETSRRGTTGIVPENVWKAGARAAVMQSLIQVETEGVRSDGLTGFFGNAILNVLSPFGDEDLMTGSTQRKWNQVAELVGAQKPFPGI